MKLNKLQLHYSKITQIAVVSMPKYSDQDKIMRLNLDR